MNLRLNAFWTCTLLVSFSANDYAQKINVGYDKSADFKHYKTYSWAELSAPVTRPMLYITVVGAVDGELKSKGLIRVDNDGDLILISIGGTDLGINQAAGTPFSQTSSGPPPTFNATMWTGATGPSNLMAPYVAEGTLVLTFVDRSANQTVWSGSVKEKLDIENKQKSLERADKAIVKLLKKFPPSRK